MKFKNVNEAIAWLDTQKNTVPNINGAGVEKVKMALAFIGDPHHGLPAIHITGTNGKGSTTAFLRELLLLKKWFRLTIIWNILSLVV